MKQFLIFFIVVMLVDIANAQKIKDEELKFARAGFKGGINYSFVTGDLENTGGRTRAHFGVLVEYPVFDQFYVQGELFYSAQGYTMEVENQTQEIGMNYIALPVLAKYYIKNSFAIEAGLQVANLSTFGNEDLPDNDPFYDSFNNFDFGAVVGIGYYLESGLFFQARYYSGLRDFNNTSIEAKNQMAQVSLGYLFKTKDNRRIFNEETQDADQ
ncbi:PorT family protein [Aquimarina sp. ERC-38]|uniref:porin family protein n=1 Tax=Aquimarina sp. ERC-38 TaxID=2949996 RepID=UPI0022474C96|nr:porin family protein [Aquimarina sp. ERC-38]UZO79984.1 PorT family protein [Aquimarina sp. ERC-38]